MNKQIFKQELRYKSMKKGESQNLIYLVIALLVSIICAISFVSSVETIINVPETNFPPYQTANIENQSWAMGRNLTNAFDLDDYFDDDEDILTFNYTLTENITIIINETTNLVSFFSEANFSGVRNVTFIANDGFSNTSSNLVFLIITNDTQAPQWTLISITPSVIYQNTIVNFSANWTDNVQLSHYIFSINQGSGWVNYSETDFSGTENISSTRIQISAAPGTNVLWKFYAFDTTGNMNETSIQYFTISQIETPPSTERDTSSSSERRRTTERSNTIFPFSSEKTKKLFSVTPTDFIIQLKQGESIERLLKINNLDINTQNFSLKVEDLSNFVTLNNYNVLIPAGKSAIVASLFSANRRAIVDIYFGKIIVQMHTEIEEIPIILTINPYEIDFEVEVKIPEEYKEMKIGQSLFAQIIIKSKKDPIDSPMKLYYSVMDIRGNTLEKWEEIINSTEAIIILNKSFYIPEDTYPGDYIFFARLTKDKKTSMGLDKFSVGEKFNLYSFIKSNFLIMILILAVTITILLIVYYHRTKEKERLLNLYVMINELKILLEQNKMEEAILEYQKIKQAYNEKVSPAELRNIEELKLEMQKLIKEFNNSINIKEIKEATESSQSKEPQKNESEQNKSEKNPPQEKTIKEEIPSIKKEVKSDSTLEKDNKKSKIKVKKRIPLSKSRKVKKIKNKRDKKRR